MLCLRGQPVRRREFITLVGGAAAAWPLAARAQQPPMPLIGFLRSTEQNGTEQLAGAFLQGLNESGYVDRQNVAIEYRWGNDDAARLPDLRGRSGRSASGRNCRQWRCRQAGYGCD